MPRVSLCCCTRSSTLSIWKANKIPSQHGLANGMEELKGEIMRRTGPQIKLKRAGACLLRFYFVLLKWTAIASWLSPTEVHLGLFQRTRSYERTMLQRSWLRNHETASMCDSYPEITHPNDLYHSTVPQKVFILTRIISVKPQRPVIKHLSICGLWLVQLVIRWTHGAIKSEHYLKPHSTPQRDKAKLPTVESSLFILLLSFSARSLSY